MILMNKNNFREILKAEPNVVDLLKQEPYFYETGIHVGALVAGDEENLLKAVMHSVRLNIFASRGVSDFCLYTDFPKEE
jgi:hypothetical protein